MKLRDDERLDALIEAGSAESARGRIDARFFWRYRSTMIKPVIEVGLTTFDGKSGRARAVLDTGSHLSLICQDRLPPGAQVTPAGAPRTLKTAARGGKLRVTGVVVMEIALENRLIRGEVLVSPDPSAEMIIGAAMMQAWDITIRHRNGKTKISVGRDLRDPDIQEVD